MCASHASCQELINSFSSKYICKSVVAYILKESSVMDSCGFTIDASGLEAQRLFCILSSVDCTFYIAENLTAKKIIPLVQYCRTTFS